MEQKISNLIDYLLLGIAFLWAVCGYILACKMDNGLWFSRSGSVIVLLCVIVEYRLASLQQLGYGNAKKAFSQGIVSSGMIPPHKKRIGWITHVQIVIGTLIWGYGDLLF
jgi:hypothetical protein